MNKKLIAISLILFCCASSTLFAQTKLKLDGNSAKVQASSSRHVTPRHRPVVEQPDFDAFFLDRGVRMQYYREGNRMDDKVFLAEEPFILQRATVIGNEKAAPAKKGAPSTMPNRKVNHVWAGSQRFLLDPTDNGDYRVVLRNAGTGQEIYSRTYNTLFGEYKNTPEGEKKIVRYEEVVQFPMPIEPVIISLQKRNKEMDFETQAEFPFEPDLAKEDILSGGEENYGTTCLQYNGDPHNHIDIVIVAEGYGKKDLAKMQKDFEEFKKILFVEEPFKSRQSDFNVWGVYRNDRPSGITDPRANKKVESAVGASYNTFGSGRYLMTFNLFKLHELASLVPWDHIIIMANCSTYGGGAIYNFYAMSAVTEMSAQILPHELGHSIGGLADEYVDEDLSYGDIHQPDVEPLEPNVTNLVDFKSKWQDLLPNGDIKIYEPCTLDNPMGTCGELGLYEGAAYHPTGFYRPVMNCMMRYYAPFCPVCLRTMNRMFDLYCK